jgi:hypothetical protein
VRELALPDVEGGRLRLRMQQVRAALHTALQESPHAHKSDAGAKGGSPWSSLATSSPQSWSASARLSIPGSASSEFRQCQSQTQGKQPPRGMASVSARPNLF